MSLMRSAGSHAPARWSSSFRTLSENCSGFFPARLSSVMIGVFRPSNTRKSPSSVRSMRGARSRNSGSRYTCQASSGMVTWESDEMRRYSVIVTSLSDSSVCSRRKQHLVRVELGNGRAEPVEQFADDVLCDEQCDAPQEESVRHRAAVELPRRVEGGWRHTLRTEPVEIVAEKVLFLGAARLGLQRGRDVIRDVETPVPVLHELPVEERRTIVAIEKRVPHVRVAVDDGPPGARRARRERSQCVDEPLGIANAVGYAHAQWSVEVPPDLLDAARLQRVPDARLEPRRGGRLRVLPRVAVQPRQLAEQRGGLLDRAGAQRRPEDAAGP